MSKTDWKRHMAEMGLISSIPDMHRGPEELKAAQEALQASLDHMKSCMICLARRKTGKANRRRRERDAAMHSLGLVKTPYGWE